MYHERFMADDDEMLTMLLPNLQVFCDRGTTVDIGKLYNRKFRVRVLLLGVL